jgi:hypothetical protein
MIFSYQIVILISFSREAVRQFANNDFIGTRVAKSDGTLGDFVWKTYQEILDKSIDFAKGLISLGAKPVPS